MDWKNKPHLIFNKIKLQMYTKGIQNFYFADFHINDFDPNHTGRLTQHEFNLFMNKVGVFLSTQQLRNIKDLYGKGIIMIYFQRMAKQHIKIYQKMLSIQFLINQQILLEQLMINQILIKLEMFHCLKLLMLIVQKNIHMF